MISSTIIKFLLIPGVHPLVGWQMGGWGWGWVWVWGGIPCTDLHMHACTHMHVKHANHAKHGCLHVGGHLQFLYMYTCACVHVHACMCGGTPPMPQDAPRHPHLPPPRATGSPKQQNSISHELIKIIQFCLKILYL